MKCPHCGFVTFDHLQSCPGCSQSFALVRPLTQQGLGDSPHVLRDEPELRARLRDRLHNARLDRRKENPNPLASGPDPEAPDWYRPRLDSNDGAAEQVQGGPSRRSGRGKEEMSVHPADPSPEEGSPADAGPQDDSSSNTAASNADATPDATGELPFSADQPGFTDWRVELRERLKRIRARRESEQDEAEADASGQPDEAVDESEVPVIDDLSLDAGETEEIREEGALPELDQTLEQPGEEDVIELSDVLGGPDLPLRTDAIEAAADTVERPEQVETTAVEGPVADLDELLDDGPPAETAGKAATGWDEDLIADLQAGSAEPPDVGPEDAAPIDEKIETVWEFDDDAKQSEVTEDAVLEEVAEEAAPDEAVATALTDEGDTELEEASEVVAEPAAEDVSLDELLAAPDEAPLAESGEAAPPFAAERVEEPADDEAAETEATETEAAETEATETEATKTEEAETEAAETEAAETEAGETEAAETEAAETEATETEAAEIETTETEAAETDARELEFDELDEVDEVDEVDETVPEPAPGLELDIEEIPASEDVAGVEWDTPAPPELMRPSTSGLDRSAAPLGRRAIAGIADALALVIIAGVLVGAASSATEAAYDVLLTDALLPLVLAWGIFAFGYSVFFTGTCGQTIGKMVMRLRVVSTDQFSVGFGRATKRLVASVPSILVLGIGFFLALRDPKRRTVYDRVAQTRVVKA